MIGYKFTGDRYISKGINENLPVEVIILLWDLIEDKRKDTRPMDYLQIFELQGLVENGKKLLKITHRQEVPPYKKEYKLKHFIELSGKIYVIDDVDHVTMLWANEY